MKKETRDELITIQKNIQKVNKLETKSNYDVSLHMERGYFGLKHTLDLVKVHFQRIVSYNVKKDYKVSYRIMHSNFNYHRYKVDAYAYNSFKKLYILF